MLGRVTVRHLMLSVLLTYAFCLAYFYTVDGILLSTAGFAPIFKFLLLSYDIRTAWISLGACALAVACRRPGPLLILVDHLGRHPLLVAITCAVAFASGALLVYHNHPFSMDEYAAVFQSKVFRGW